MREKPILFNEPMVRAILHGKKHATRRPVIGKFDCRIRQFHHLEYCPDPRIGLQAYFQTEDGERLDGIRAPFFPGDHLWVRETWAANVPGCETQGGYSYRVDHSGLNDGPYRIKWKPSIHMPRAASRLTLEITKIEVERLQNLTDEDAWDEGADELDGRFSDADICATAKKYGLMAEDVTTTFVHLWDGLYARQGLGWAENPWVWVVRFAVLRSEKKCCLIKKTLDL